VKTVVVTGSFDDLRSEHVRFLEEAGKLGTLHVLPWTDAIVAAVTGEPPKFPLAERHYLLQAIRYVQSVGRIDTVPHDPDALPAIAGLQADIWAVTEADDTPQKRAFCAAHGLGYRVFTAEDLAGFPTPAGRTEDGIRNPTGTLRGTPHTVGHTPPARQTVIVTGCYDWLHSGHVRFFEEVSELGDLLVAVGNDANVRHLKGAGHPLQSQEERRYMVGAIRYVTQALITSGHGWMDAEPEIERLKPDMYAVNEDGDKPEKRAFCAEHGLEYVVLKRTPKPGLSKRSSTDLRGF
jgi:cytidyltransferase-like protein